MDDNIPASDTWTHIDHMLSEPPAFSAPFNIFDFAEDERSGTDKVSLPMSTSWPNVWDRQQDQSNAATNGQLASFGTGSHGSVPRGHILSSPTLDSATGIDEAYSSGNANGSEGLQADAQRVEGQKALACFSDFSQGPRNSAQPNLAFSYTNPMEAFSPLTQPLQAAQAQSAYAPFSAAFQTSASATDFRKHATRFGRRPYRPPEADATIEAIANNRQLHVRRIYDAMVRGDVAKDNINSIAMRRWVHEAFYSSTLVEAFAHKVFDCLLEQARDGFRGWQHNDYATDDRKGEPEDRNFSCSERLENIIAGLEEEKTVCEDVMSSACQIRMFVNAPKAYARRKEANRNGNSKRGRSNVAPARSSANRVSKTRKLATRSASHMEHTSAALSLQESGTSTQSFGSASLSPQDQIAQHPYYSIARMQQHSLSPPFTGLDSHIKPYSLRRANSDTANDVFTSEHMAFMPPPHLHETPQRLYSEPIIHGDDTRLPPASSALVTPNVPVTDQHASFNTVPWFHGSGPHGGSDEQPGQNLTGISFEDPVLFPLDDSLFFSAESQLHGLPMHDTVRPSDFFLDPDLQTTEFLHATTQTGFTDGDEEALQKRE